MRSLSDSREGTRPATTERVDNAAGAEEEAAGASAGAAGISVADGFSSVKVAIAKFDRESVTACKRGKFEVVRERKRRGIVSTWEGTNGEVEEGRKRRPM